VGHTAAPETYEVKSAQPSAVEIKQDGIEQPVAAPRQELSVRSKKSRPGDRLHKGDGTTLLVSCGICLIVSCQDLVILITSTHSL
jgi:hypothetical protein